MAVVITTPSNRIDRRQLDAALDRIGNQGSPVWRERLASALDETAPAGLIVRSRVPREVAEATADRWTPARLAGLTTARGSLRARDDRHRCDRDSEHRVGDVALALEPDDPRCRALHRIQSGFDELYAVEAERERLVADGDNRPPSS